MTLRDRTTGDATPLRLDFAIRCSVRIECLCIRLECEQMACLSLEFCRALRGDNSWVPNTWMLSIENASK